MKKVKLNDLGRGVHFFLENFPEEKKTEFVVVRYYPEQGEAPSPDSYTLVEATEDLCKAAFDKDGCNDWREASLRKWLNGEYLNSLLDSFPELKDAAVTFLRDLTSDDGLKDYDTCAQIDILADLNCTDVLTIRDILRQAGEKLPRQRTSSAKMEALYRQGLTDQEIAGKAGCVVSTVRSWRIKQNLPTNKKGAAPPAPVPPPARPVLDRVEAVLAALPADASPVTRSAACDLCRCLLWDALECQCENAASEEATT